MKRIVLCLSIFLMSSSAMASVVLDISLKNGTKNEQMKKAQLERVVAEYDVSKWTFTKKILIDEAAQRPGSHPVLTFNTFGLNRDLSMLTSYIHEQIHWYEEVKPDGFKAAIDAVRELYPNAPKEPPEGADNETSTYLHLIVCYLEYDGMRQLVGEERARKVISKNSEYFYKWIYRRVLSDDGRLKDVIEKSGLTL